MAVLGLAVSGKKKAADILIKFKNSSQFKANRKLYIDNMGQIIDSSVKEHGLIKRSGLIKYFKATSLKIQKPRLKDSVAHEIISATRNRASAVKSIQ